MTFTTEKTMTADDLLRLDSEGVRGELIQGALCETLPTGVRHGKVVVNLAILLGGFIKPRRLGWVLASDVGFLLERNPDTVREPDIAYISAHNLPLDAEVAGYYVGAPDLAVEVFSPNDSPREVFDKARMWISFGVPLVWTVDPEIRTIEVHRPNQPLLKLSDDDTIDGGPVLPGFSCPVRDLFDL